MILTLQSTTFGAHGGIPTYNRVVCRVLNELAEPIERQVFLVTDTPGDIECHRAEFPNLTLTAFSGKRAAFVRQVMKLVLGRRLDLLLVGHVNYAPLGLVLKRLQPKLRYGVMVHGTEVWSRLSPLKRHALREANFITSVSEYTKSQVVSINGANPNRISLLPNTLEWENADGESASAEVTSLPSGLKLLSVCRFEKTDPYKGIDTVIEALPRVLSRFPNLQYYVVGTGNDLERHKMLAATHGVAEHVHFPGSLAAATLRDYYRVCDLFVMPSAGEGFGIVFLEAMRYAKATIGARSGGIPEVVEDGVTGRLIEYGNSEQLTETLLDLCLDSEQRYRLGLAGYQRLQETFTFAHFKNNLTEILNRQYPSRAFEREKSSPVTAAESP